jgi:TolA-binding protein
MDYESNDYYCMRFPRGNWIFSKFHDKPFDEQESIVKLGMTMLECGKERKITLNDDEWASKLDKINNKNDKKQQELNERIREYKESIEKMREKGREELKNGVSSAVNIERNRYENTIEGYEEKLKEMDTYIDELKNEKWNVQENCRDEYDKKLEEIRLLERERTEKREDEYRKAMDELSNKMNNEGDKCKVASNKGKEGEADVKQFLVMSLPKVNIDDVAQKGGAGDLIIQDASKNVMVEVKKYHSANVKTSEVNKFKRDVKNNNFTGGIFISLHSGICNIDNWTIGTIDGKPTVYLCKAADNMENIITAYKIIKKLSEINIDWTITEKLKIIQDYVKQFDKEKKKKLKLINNFSREMIKCINDDEQKLNVLIESLKS